MTVLPLPYSSRFWHIGTDPSSKHCPIAMEFTSQWQHEGRNDHFLFPVSSIKEENDGYTPTVLVLFGFILSGLVPDCPLCLSTVFHALV